MTDGLIDTPGASDAGGIAARRGFRIRDHVAARIPFEMLRDPTIHRRDRGTADDILVRSKAAPGRVSQCARVKATEVNGSGT